MLDPMFCLLTMVRCIFHDSTPHDDIFCQDIGDDTQRLLRTRSLLLFHYRLWGRGRWGVQNRLVRVNVLNSVAWTNFSQQECIGGTSTLGESTAARSCVKAQWPS